MTHCSFLSKFSLFFPSLPPRDSFGENERDSCLLALQERFLQQERMGFRGSVAPSAAAAAAEEEEERRMYGSGRHYHHHHHHPEHIPMPQVNRRKNYIIFEQNDEDTLI